LLGTATTHAEPESTSPDAVVTATALFSCVTCVTGFDSRSASSDVSIMVVMRSLVPWAKFSVRPPNMAYGLLPKAASC
jgi:hypothetical protein